MKAIRATLSVSLPVALACVAAAMVNQNPGPRAGLKAPPVAVVDIDAVLKRYAGAEAKEREWAQMNNGYVTELEQLENAVKQKELAIETFDKGTPERQDATFKYQMARFAAEKTAELRTRQANDKRVEIQIELYDEIRAGIKAFALQNNVDIVLRARDRTPGVPRNAQQLKVVLDDIQQRDLMYHSQQVDITEQVINFLKGWVPPKPK